MSTRGTSTAIVTTGAGRVRGKTRGESTAFLGIPYAEADRFRPPRPQAGWTGVRDATAPGPAAPQPPSRLEQALGSMGITAQDEHCLWLNLWAPRSADGPLPVLVWLHGGAFFTGSASQPWYDGARLAATQRCIVVTVNYRLGALGFLRLPGTDEFPAVSNLGVSDQHAALAWVQQNIAAFGGDPHAVTLAGQSAGAQSALALLHSTAGLFGRLVLQSAPLGLAPLDIDEANRRTELFLAALGLGGEDCHRLSELPVARLLDAQGTLNRQLAQPLQLGPAFQLVADDTTVPTDLLAAPAQTGTPVLLGSTRHEADAFCVPNPSVQAMTHETARDALRPLFGEDTARRYAERRAGDPDAGPARIAADLTGDYFFQQDLEPLAATLHGAGNPTRTYRFGWHPANNPLRACHCIELPFTFGNLHAWRDAPLLRGATTSELTRLVHDTQPLLGEFVRG